MSRVPLMIDARPRGNHGPLATELIGGRPILVRLVELARLAGERDEADAVCVHARAEEHARLASLFDEFERPRLTFVTGPPPENAPILRTNRVYDAKKLKRALDQGCDPESAVVWRLDGPHGLTGVEDELIRRQTFQPLGRYWAFVPARSLAERLVPTWVRPNMVTGASALVFLVGAAMVAWGGSTLPTCCIAGFALAFALVLDTADGHLARLQGTASAFGRWLDANLDELNDMALHAAIAWACFVRDSWTGWLVIGMIYAMGKYLFMIGHEADTAPKPLGLNLATSVHPLKQAVRLAGHADIRWHLWIVLALLGRLEIALVAYMVYFPARAVARGITKGVTHA